jgi:putative molybdopterin biosynthesis protein
MSTQTPTRDGTVLLSPADAARMAAVSRDTIYRLVDRGDLRAVHVGRQLRIREADFDAYLERARSDAENERTP